MSESEITKENTFFFVSCLNHYITQLYKRSNREAEDTTEDQVYAPQTLRSLLRRCVDHYKTRNYLDEFVSFISLEDRVYRLRNDLKVKLTELGELAYHAYFVRGCVFYILAGVDMKDRGFTEASDLVVDAICEACMDTEQRKYLYLWESVTLASIYGQQLRLD